MPRSSSTWLFSVCLLLTGCAAPATSGGPRVCLPPVIAGGQRLIELPAPRMFWLEPLLRQHELCWRSPVGAGEQRVVLLGSSAVFGFPLPVEETFGALLNEGFVRDGLSAHLFNLAWVATYQVRDALILHEALAYHPDVILYPLNLSDFYHHAPVLYPGLMAFFDRNSPSLRALVENPPPGLEEPLREGYGYVLDKRILDQHWIHRLREIGMFVRIAAKRHAEHLVERYTSFRIRETGKTKGRQTRYDCGTVREKFDRTFGDWQRWNVLVYLEELQRTRGIDVLVVNWPVAHDPVDTCYNARYPAAAVEEFDSWLEEETRARGLGYLDLHDLLPPSDFLDSLHAGAAGHRRIADEVELALRPIVRDRITTPPTEGGA